MDDRTCRALADIRRYERRGPLWSAAHRHHRNWILLQQIQYRSVDERNSPSFVNCTSDLIHRLTASLFMLSPLHLELQQNPPQYLLTPQLPHLTADATASALAVIARTPGYAVSKGQLNGCV